MLAAPGVRCVCSDAPRSKSDRVRVENALCRSIRVTAYGADDVRMVFWRTTHVLDILEHPNQQRYGGQRIFAVQRDDYVYLVPFVEDEHKSVMHKIRLNNTSKYPLTTAPALIVHDDRALAFPTVMALQAGPLAEH